jgi:hypothetical protein
MPGHHFHILGDGDRTIAFRVVSGFFQIARFDSTQELQTGMAI